MAGDGGFQSCEVFGAAGECRVRSVGEDDVVGGEGDGGGVLESGDFFVGVAGGDGEVEGGGEVEFRCLEGGDREGRAVEAVERPKRRAPAVAARRINKRSTMRNQKKQLGHNQ